ncbi:hypothetical protein, partial [Vibrio sp. M260118]|uniref:hypothetical protein n=1 Tax=Vibrio sp. M260118 TaxID=3020896 RepID=UPI002F3EA996
ISIGNAFITAQTVHYFRRDIVFSRLIVQGGFMFANQQSKKQKQNKPQQPSQKKVPLSMT